MEEEEIPLPKAEFIEDVAKFLAGRSPDQVLDTLAHNHRAYKMKEQELLQNKARLMQKVPELQRAVDIVSQLIKQRDGGGDDLTVDYELAGSVWAKAVVKCTDTVNIWLGANVMLEYPLDEALELLQTNLSNCKSNLKTNDGSLDYVRDCVTITQVTISRIYNYDVEQRRKAKAEGGEGSTA